MELTESGKELTLRKLKEEENSFGMFCIGCAAALLFFILITITAYIFTKSVLLSGMIGGAALCLDVSIVLILASMIRTRTIHIAR